MTAQLRQWKRSTGTLLIHRCYSETAWYRASMVQFSFVRRDKSHQHPCHSSVQQIPHGRNHAFLKDSVAADTELMVQVFTPHMDASTVYGAFYGHGFQRRCKFPAGYTQVVKAGIMDLRLYVRQNISCVSFFFGDDSVQARHAHPVCWERRTRSIHPLYFNTDDQHLMIYHDVVFVGNSTRTRARDDQ